MHKLNNKTNNSNYGGLGHISDIEKHSKEAALSEEKKEHIKKCTELNTKYTQKLYYRHLSTFLTPFCTYKIQEVQNINKKKKKRN